MHNGFDWTCLWPGLRPLWRGRWPGLLAAGAFAAVLNGALLATFAGPPHWGWWWVALWWCAAAGGWLMGLWWNLAVAAGAAQSDETLQTEPPGHVDLFPEAQAEYLKGDWYRAEQLARQQLAVAANDFESRLLLATLFRHTRRTEEARRQLQHLAGEPRAAWWRLELERESSLLDRLTNGRLEEAEDPARNDEHEIDEEDSDHGAEPSRKAA